MNYHESMVQGRELNSYLDHISMIRIRTAANLQYVREWIHSPRKEGAPRIAEHTRIADWTTKGRSDVTYQLGATP